MSSLYFDVTTKVQNSGLVQTNEDGTDKCPLFWDVFARDELSNRYSELFVNRYAVTINKFESVSLPILSGVYKSTKTPVLKVSLYTEGTTGDTQVFNVGFGVINEYTEYTLPMNTVYTYNIPIPENTSVIEFVNSIDNSLYIFEDYEISFATSEITDFNPEFTNLSIDSKLVNSKTLANKIRQRKTGLTAVRYTFDPIITSDQNKEIDDVRDFARLNKLLMLVYINYSETNGDTLANFPEESGFIKYFYVTHSTTQKTGLYEYLNLTIANQPNVAIR